MIEFCASASCMQKMTLNFCDVQYVVMYCKQYSLQLYTGSPSCRLCQTSYQHTREQTCACTDTHAHTHTHTHTCTHTHTHTYTHMHTHTHTYTHTHIHTLYLPALACPVASTVRVKLSNVSVKLISDIRRVTLAELLYSDEQTLPV